MPSEQVNRSPSRGVSSKSGRAESFLQTENFGGVNFQSSDLNIPLEDSPQLVNVKVDINGNLRKRDGSVARGTGSEPAGTSAVPYETKTGDSLVISKAGKAITVNLLPDKESLDQKDTVTSFANVWRDEAEDLRADWVVTNEATPRVIWVCSTNVPIQLQIIEQIVSLDGTSTFDVSDSRFTNITFGNAFLIYDDTKYDLSAKSGTDPDFTYTISGSDFPTGTGVIIAFAWQWWAEAIWLTANMIYDSAVRIPSSTGTDADKTIPIPTDMLRNVAADSLIMAGADEGRRLPFALFPNNKQTVTAHTWKTDLRPNSATQYNFSYGQFLESGSLDAITPGTTHVTYGALPATLEVVHFVRYYRMNFNGDTRTIAGQDLVVYAEDGEWDHNLTGVRTAYSPGSNTFWLVQNNPTFGTPVFNNTTAAPWIRLDSTFPFGIPEQHVLRLINVGNSTYAGSSAIEDFAEKSANQFLSGYAVGAYGLQDFANYSGAGGFPTTIDIFQNRVCLSGFPNFPSTVIFSSVSNSKLPTEAFQDFQILLGDGLADAAFDRSLDVKSDQKIVALKSWQSQLFAFTQDNVVRLWGGDVNIDVSPTNCFTSNIGAQGAKNPQSVITTDTSVLFLGTNGVYAVVSTDDTGGYTLQNIGLKIRPVIEETDKFNDSSAWMMWDDSQSELYLALADTNQVFVANRLFVLNMARAAWSEYTIASGYFMTVDGISVSDRVILFYDHFGNYNTTGTAPTDSTYWMEMNRPFNFDFVKAETGVADPLTTNEARFLKITHTTKQEQRSYAVNMEDTAAAFSFRALPLQEVDDLDVVIDGNAQTLGTDYIKSPDGRSIFLITSSVDDGETMTITLKNQVDDHPVEVWVDNKILVEDTDYTVDETTNLYRVDFTSAPHADAVVVTGLHFPAYYFSPLFIRSEIGMTKRIKQFYALFRNDRYSATYTEADANTDSSQDPDEIADKYKQTVDFNVSLIYNNSTYGDTVTEVYTSEDGVYETGDFTGIESPSARFFKHTRFTVPIYGQAYGFQVVVWNFDGNVFEMVGYQLETVTLGKQSASKRFNI